MYGPIRGGILSAYTVLNTEYAKILTSQAVFKHVKQVCHYKLSTPIRASCSSAATNNIFARFRRELLIESQLFIRSWNRHHSHFKRYCVTPVTNPGGQRFDMSKCQSLENKYTPTYDYFTGFYPTLAFNVLIGKKARIRNAWHSE